MLGRVHPPTGTGIAQAEVVRTSDISVITGNDGRRIVDEDDQQCEQREAHRSSHTAHPTTAVTFVADRDSENGAVTGVVTGG